VDAPGPWRARSFVVEVTLIVSALLIFGCGGEAATTTSDPQASEVSEPTGMPELAAKPKRRGEILIKGETSPTTYGPFSAAGPYNLRFEQYNPPPGVSIGQLGPFVASTVTESGGTPIDNLVSTTDPRGRYQVYLSGRFFIDVAVADAAYVIRLTPL